MKNSSTSASADPARAGNHGDLPISRWGVGEVELGRRVIVRRALTQAERATTDKKVTDVIGHVLSMDPFVVRPQLRAGVRAGDDVEAVDFSNYHILVVKALPDHPVRNSDIRAVELATAKAFPGIEHAMVGGWLLRAGDGITERSNSALPIGPSAGTQPVPLAEIRAFYQRHHLPVRIAIPDRICKPAAALVSDSHWHIGPEIMVMTRSLSNDDSLPQLPRPANIRVEILNQPDADWLALYHFRGKALPERALKLLRDEIDGRMCFGRLLYDDGLRQPRTVAITRGTLTDSEDGRIWLGFSAVEVAEDMRRQGLGTLLGLYMLHWGAQNGATDTYLQVIAKNEAGIALYRRLGFTEHHRHRYAEWEETEQ